MSNYPLWFKEAPIMGQSPAKEVRWRVWNRSGETTAVGRVYQFDVGLTTTSTSETDAITGNLLPAVTSYAWQAPESCWRNIVIPSTTYARQGVFCRADEVAVDNAELWVTVISPSTTLTTCDTLASNGSSDQGDGAITTAHLTFYPSVNGSSKAVQSISTSQGTSRLIAMNTSGFTIASGDIATVTVMFNGWGF